jgi:hypothetical protein
VSPVAFAPTEIADVDFDGIVRTAAFLRTAQHILEHDPSTEFRPNSGGCRIELMLLLDSVIWNAVNDVLREEQNLHKFQVNLLKTCTVPN